MTLGRSPLARFIELCAILAVAQCFGIFFSIVHRINDKIGYRACGKTAIFTSGQFKKIFFNSELKFSLVLGSFLFDYEMVALAFKIYACLELKLVS